MGENLWTRLAVLKGENDSDIKFCYSDTFENINDVIDYINNVPINRNIFDDELSSERFGKDSFHDFESFSDAFSALKYGTDIYFDTFYDEFKKIDNYIKKHIVLDKVSYKNDVVGFTPIVPKFIIGNPNNMVNQIKKERTFTSATIIFEKAITCGHDTDEMISFATIIFNLIQMLEKKGIRCEVYISSVFRVEDEVYHYKIKIKNFMQPLNLFKMQFPVISSDMFRRIGFRLLESCPNLKQSYWKHSYGRTLIGEDGYDLKNGQPSIKLQKLLGIKQNDIFIPNSAYFNYDLDDDIDEIIPEIIRKTNFKKYIKISEVNE